MWTVRSDSGAASTIQRRSRRLAVPLRVQVRSLDDLQRSHRLPAPQLLKIDVEGFELKVLRGFESQLHANRPMVLAETVAWYLRRAGTELGELYDFMQTLGYKPFAFPLVRHGLSHRVVLSAVEKSHAERFKNLKICMRGVFERLRLLRQRFGDPFNHLSQSSAQ